MEILGKTSLENYNVIWFYYVGFEYGINENFDPATLMCEGSNCNNIDAHSQSRYQEIADLIKAKVASVFSGKLTSMSGDIPPPS